MVATWLWLLFSWIRGFDYCLGNKNVNKYKRSWKLHEKMNFKDRFLWDQFIIFFQHLVWNMFPVTSNWIIKLQYYFNEWLHTVVIIHSYLSMNNWGSLQPMNSICNNCSKQNLLDTQCSILCNLYCLYYVKPQLLYWPLTNPIIEKVFPTF